MDFLDTNKRQIEDPYLLRSYAQQWILKFLKDKISGRKKDSFEPRCIN